MGFVSIYNFRYSLICFRHFGWMDYLGINKMSQFGYDPLYELLYHLKKGPIITSLRFLIKACNSNNMLTIHYFLREKMKCKRIITRTTIKNKIEMRFE